MPKIKFKRGLKANLPTLDAGEPGFTTDTNELFIGSDAGNVGIAKKEDINGIPNQIANLESQLSGKADQSNVDALSTSKADKSYVDDNVSSINTQLAEKAKVIMTFSQLQDAVQSTTPLTCNIGSQIDITENIAVPEHVILQFNQSGKFNVADGITITFNGYIDAPYREIFIGNGTINGKPQNERLIANWFGVFRDVGLKIDQTSVIAKFLNITNAMNTEAFFLKGDYYCNEIDLSVFISKGGITISGEGKQGEHKSTTFRCLDKTKITNAVGAFVFLSDAATTAGTYNRNITIHNLSFVDEDITITNYGLYANGVNFANVKNIMVNGFKTGVALGAQWNSKYESIEIYHFSEYGLFIGPNPVANASTLSKIHCSSNKNALANIYCKENRSFVFYELTTEGSATTHVKFTNGNENFIVYGWHVEGGKNLFELIDFTDRRGNIEVYGANIFLTGDTSITDSRLFLLTNCTSIGGVSTLTMRGSMRLHSNTHADYLRLDRIYSSDIMLNFGTPAPTVDFTKVGYAILGTSTTGVTSNIAPIGYYSADYPMRRGISGNYEVSVRRSSSSLSSGTKVFKLKEARESKKIYFDIDVGVNVATNDFAKFKVCIASDGTVGQYEISSIGTYSKAVVFTWDNVTQELKATSSTGTGTFDFYIMAHVSPV